jgi:hypothetical protein
MANDTALSQESAAEVAESPMIILWNPQRAYGVGGGGGDGNDMGIIGGGAGDDPGLTTIKGAPETTPTGPVTIPASPTGTPDTLTTEPLRQGDPSTMILGIPDEKVQGTYLTESSPRSKLLEQISPVSLLMMGLGLIALVSAVIALLLSRR